MLKTWINNQVLPSDEARISVSERGFRFGDGVFETVPVHGGMPYLWIYHEERLNAGLKALRIGFDTTAVLTHALELLAANAVSDGMLRISISRGIGSRGYLPQNASPTLVMETLPCAETPQPGVALWLSGYEKPSPRALPTHCKLSQGVNSTLARMEAADHGCYDALQLSASGHPAEAGSANLFWLKDGTLHTPALSTGALYGVTRRRICELSPYRVEEGAYALEELRTAQGVFLTNAAYGVLAVGSLQPSAMQWDSTALAERLNQLLKFDIMSDTFRLRESLART